MMGICVTKDKTFLPPENPIKSSVAGSTVILASKRYADIQKFYRFTKVLGHGQFGTVREALMNGTGRTVAVKSINKEKIKKDLYLLKRELDVLRMIDHPNVINYYETYEDEKYLHIVMELCTGGDLFDKLIDMGTLNESEVAALMKKLLLAVNHIHGLSIVHRDLKPENFLFASREPGAEIKIIDFGMSIKHQATNDLTTLVGTPYYLAPEVLRGRYGRECDVWSLGVTMYLMLCGYQPFEGEDMREIFARISKGMFDFSRREWEGISENAKELIRKMMSVNPSKRISVQDALRHAWLASPTESPRVVAKEVLNSLKRYKAPKKIQQEAMKVMIKFLSESDLENLKNNFIDLDRDQTGFITVHDLEVAMQDVGLSLPVEELKSTDYTEIINSLDYLRLGKIKYSDFLIATLDKKKLLDEELLFLAFQHFDADNDGFINVADLKKAIGSNGTEMTNEDIELMIADWDMDHNHLMDYQEFKSMMEQSKLHAVPEPSAGPSRMTTRRETVRKTIAKIASPFEV